MERLVILRDWIEFETFHKDKKIFINIKREEISEIKQIINVNDMCRICLKNGHEYLVNMPYEKVMELV